MFDPDHGAFLTRPCVVDGDGQDPALDIIGGRDRDAIGQHDVDVTVPAPDEVASLQHVMCFQSTLRRIERRDDLDHRGLDEDASRPEQE